MKLNRLNSDQKSEWNFNAAIGKTITAVLLDDEESVLHMLFSDGYKISIRDDGQICCELRYMHTDDNLGDYVGAQLLGAEVKDAPDVGDDAGCVHDVQFLEIQTSKGVFTMSNHNENNGYYGGFCLVVEVG